MDEKTLRSLAAADRRAKARSEAAHAALVDAIWEAADSGWQQAKIVQATGLTRERIRQLCDPKYRERALERRSPGPSVGSPGPSVGRPMPTTGD